MKADYIGASICIRWIRYLSTGKINDPCVLNARKVQNLFVIFSLSRMKSNHMLINKG